MKLFHPNYYLHFLLLALTAVLGCAGLNNPNIRTPIVDPPPYGGGYGGGGGYGQPYYGGSYNDDYYRRRELESAHHDRIQAERERERLERERIRALQYQPPPPPPPQAQEQCPAGFSPSEQKCSQQERRHGCKDIRLPNGLGCVRR